MLPHCDARPPAPSPDSPVSRIIQGFDTEGENLLNLRNGSWRNAVLTISNKGTLWSETLPVPSLAFFSITVT